MGRKKKSRLLDYVRKGSFRLRRGRSYHFTLKTRKKEKRKSPRMRAKGPVCCRRTSFLRTGKRGEKNANNAGGSTSSICPPPTCKKRSVPIISSLRTLKKKEGRKGPYRLVRSLLQARRSQVPVLEATKKESHILFHFTTREKRTLRQGREERAQRARRSPPRTCLRILSDPFFPYSSSGKEVPDSSRKRKRKGKECGTWAEARAAQRKKEALSDSAFPREKGF